MIIDCRKICRSFPIGDSSVQILKNVDLQVEEGEYVAIMGPSGSGKSTLMNILGCLDTPTSGELFLDGVNVGKCTDDELSDLRLYKLGFVFQNYQLLARQTALENVELPLTYAKVPRDERRERAFEALKKVGLEDRVNHEPSRLSGGQKQRVAIARAIVNNPKLILADEPTGALDSTSGRQIMELFHSLNDEGMSILMITHDIDIAAHAKRIAIIRDGVLNLDAENDPMIIAKRKEREIGVNQV
ncbi:MAG: ABC transporter ATP-binding protein [Eubacteriales bacterium]|jgi:putative ABC transport system ATP-binding protein